MSLRSSEDDTQKICGRAVSFYDGTPGTEYVLLDTPDERIVERIMPGAVDRAVREGQDVRALFNHDPNLILGRTKAGTLKLNVDDRGLSYEVEPGDTTVARDVKEHLRRGDVSGSSFGFRVKSQTWAKGGSDGKRSTYIREIRDVDLCDISPCVFPAYSASDAAIRSAEPANLENILNEARQATDAPTANIPTMPDARPLSLLMAQQRQAESLLI